MTANRNKSQDRDRTIEQILKPGTLSSGPGLNWLGHKTTSGAAAIDSLLLQGATKAELKKARVTFNEHLHHLENEHSLKITQDSDIYRIDRLNLGITE